MSADTRDTGDKDVRRIGASNNRPQRMESRERPEGLRLVAKGKDSKTFMSK